MFPRIYCGSVLKQGDFSSGSLDLALYNTSTGVAQGSEIAKTRTKVKFSISLKINETSRRIF